jgi:hypothetical protein
MHLMRCWIYLAMGGAVLGPAAPAPAQDLGGVVGGVMQPVTQTVQLAQAAEPVVQPVAKAAQPVANAAQPVVEAAQPVVEATEPVVEAAEPVTGAVTSTAGQATGGQTSGVGSEPGGSSSGGGSSTAGSAGDSSSGGGATTSAGPRTRTGYVLINGKWCKRGTKQAAAAGGTRAGGAGGPGGGSSAVLAAAAAERSLHVALAKRQARERAAKDRAGGGVLGAKPSEDDAGVLSIPGILGDPDDFSFGTGMALLALFALGFVGIVAGVTSHVIGRMRSS